MKSCQVIFIKHLGHGVHNALPAKTMVFTAFELSTSIKRPLCSSCLTIEGHSVHHVSPSKAIVLTMSHQVKEDTPDVLPDGSRLYCLPSVSHNQHRFTFFMTVQDNWNKYRVNITHLVESRITSEPSTLRAITADTMADVLEGRYNHKLRNVRIIDCRLEQLHIFTGPRPDYCH